MAALSDGPVPPDFTNAAGYCARRVNLRQFRHPGKLGFIIYLEDMKLRQIIHLKD